MKNITILMLIMTAFYANAKNTVINGTNTYDLVSYCQNYTNTWKAISFIGKLVDCEPEVLAQCDDILDLQLVKYEPLDYKFPKCQERWFKDVKKYQPNAVDDMRECAKDLAAGKTFTTEQHLRKMYFYIAYNISRCYIVSENQQKNLLSRVPTAAKKLLRKQGKSFVEKDGINPIKIYVDKVQAALNAPKYNGLQAALEELEIGFGYNYTIVNPKTDEEINKLKTDIFIGNIEFTKQYQNTLKVYLGTEEYNKFVKIYNDGEQN